MMTTDINLDVKSAVNFVKLNEFLTRSKYILNSPLINNELQFTKSISRFFITNNFVHFQVLSVKKVFVGDIFEESSDAKYSISTLLNVLENNRDLLLESEMLAHGHTYSYVNELFDESLKMLESKKDSEAIINKGFYQISLTNHSILDLIKILLNCQGHRVLFSTTVNSCSILTAFILVNLLYGTNNLISQLINIIGFDSVEYSLCEKYKCSTETSFEKSSFLKEHMFFKYEDKNLLLLFEDSDIFSATDAIFHINPCICLIQESVYEEFTFNLKESINKIGNLTELLDKNRSLNLKYIGSKHFDYVKEKIEKNNCSNKIIGDVYSKNLLRNDGFIAQLFFDNVQPAHPIFYDKLFHNISTFLITFRTVTEAVNIIPTLTNINQKNLYLWLDNISLCFSIRAHFNFKNIFVNSDKINVYNRIKHIIHTDLNSGSKSESKFLVCPFKSKPKMPVQIDYENQIKTLEKFPWKINLNKIKDNFWRFHSMFTSKNSLNSIIEIRSKGNVLLYLTNESIQWEILALSCLLGNNSLVVTSKEIPNNEKLGILKELFKGQTEVKFVKSSIEINCEELMKFDSLVTDVEIDLKSEQVVNGNCEFYCSRNIVMEHAIYFLSNYNRFMVESCGFGIK